MNVVPIKNFRKKKLQPMFSYSVGANVDDVSISEADRLLGSPKEGDMIAINPDNESDKWLVSKEFFEENYELAE